MRSKFLDENQFNISARHGTRFRSQKQILKHFLKKKTIQMPTCRAVVFNALYFSILRPKMIFQYQFLKAFVNCITTRLTCWAYHPRFVTCFDYIRGNRLQLFRIIEKIRSVRSRKDHASVELKYSKRYKSREAVHGRLIYSWWMNIPRQKIS